MPGLLIVAQQSFSWGLKLYACREKLKAVKEAATTSYHTYRDSNLTPWEKTHRIAANGTFAAFQIAEGGATLAKKPLKLLFDLKIISGLTDVIRKVSHGASREEIFNTIKFRGADLINGQIPTGSSYGFLEATGQVVDNLKLIQEGNNVIPEIVKPIKDKIEAKKLGAVQNIEDLTEIPSLFIDDVVLNQWICPITQKPIRYIVVVDGSQNEDNPIYYEREAITKWIQDTPDELPPNWPAHSALDQTNLVLSRSNQTLINTRLQLLLDHLKELLEGVERRPKGGFWNFCGCSNLDPPQYGESVI